MQETEILRNFTANRKMAGNVCSLKNYLMLMMMPGEMSTALPEPQHEMEWAWPLYRLLGTPTDGRPAIFCGCSIFYDICNIIVSSCRRNGHKMELNHGLISDLADCSPFCLKCPGPIYQLLLWFWTCVNENYHGMLWKRLAHLLMFTPGEDSCAFKATEP